MNTNIMQVISFKYTPATYSILCLTLPMYAANIQNMNSAGSKLGWQWDIKAITWYENDKLDESYKVSKICIKRSQILIIFILRIFVVVARVSFPNGQLHTGNIHVGSALDTHKIPTHKRFKRMLFIRTKHNIRMLAIILGSNFWTHNTILLKKFMHGFVHVHYILTTAKFELKMMERTSHANTGSSVWCCCDTEIRST